jgi:uncharacterized protein (DUF885 family)
LHQGFEEYLRQTPEMATSMGRHEYDDRWSDWSKGGRDRRRDLLERLLSRLNEFSKTQLSPQDRVTVRLLQSDFRSQLEANDVETHLFTITQQSGLHNRVFLTIDRMPAQTLREYENILSRVRGIPAYVDQVIAILDEGIQTGMTQPLVVVDLVGKQIETQLALDSRTTALLAAFRRFPSGISKADQEKLSAQSIEVYEKQFLPAWRKLHTYITKTYASKARPNIGLSSIPGGGEAYVIAIRRLTTTSLSAEAIHSIGETEVRRIEAEMQAIARETGFNGTLQEFEKKLHAAPEQRFHSKEEMLAYCRNIALAVEPELPKQFKQIPGLLFGIRAIPGDREAASATNAQPPSPDLSAPGWMNLNTYRPEQQYKYDKEALVLHEALPGHIFQLTLARGHQDLPDFRRFYGNSAYIEGWGLYAESLGSQLGVYRDPYSRFGQLASERFRAVRLVVDTGIHNGGWTRDQAIEYFRAHAPGEPLAEVDRYISWPAQALAYKLGELKIKELRREAEQRLGSRFDVREYHDVVLRNGVLPLDLLEEEVREYINQASVR